MTLFEYQKLGLDFKLYNGEPIDGYTVVLIAIRQRVPIIPISSLSNRLYDSIIAHIFSSKLIVSMTYDIHFPLILPGHLFEKFFDLLSDVKYR